ncbi:hypothetical protein [Streptomyces sp. NPDC001667]
MRIQIASAEAADFHTATAGCEGHAECGQQHSCSDECILGHQERSFEVAFGM